MPPQTFVAFSVKFFVSSIVRGCPPSGTCDVSAGSALTVSLPLSSTFWPSTVTLSAFEVVQVTVEESWVMTLSPILR